MVQKRDIEKSYPADYAGSPEVQATIVKTVHANFGKRHAIDVVGACQTLIATIVAQVVDNQESIGPTVRSIVSEIETEAVRTFREMRGD